MMHHRGLLKFAAMAALLLLPLSATAQAPEPQRSSGPPGATGFPPGGPPGGFREGGPPGGPPGAPGGGRGNPFLSAPPAPMPPRTVDNKPNFSGVWMAGFGDWVDYRTVELPLTKPYGQRLLKSVEAMRTGAPLADTVSDCIAWGAPRMMASGFLEIIQTPERITIITEVLHEVRRIWLDGRKHPENFDLTYGGHSVGHWEGDTLVVDTIGLKGATLDQTGTPYSDKAHLTERIKLVHGNQIENQITIDDPEAYTRPLLATKKYGRTPDHELGEYVCNNRNLSDKNGLQTVQ